MLLKEVGVSSGGLGLRYLVCDGSRSRMLVRSEFWCRSLHRIGDGELR